MPGTLEDLNHASQAGVDERLGPAPAPWNEADPIRVDGKP